jgi:putrescine aminotransferase
MGRLDSVDQVAVGGNRLYAGGSFDDATGSGCCAVLLGFDLWKPEGAFYVLPKCKNARKFLTLLYEEYKVITYLGEWFGAQAYALEPDIMTMAKGLSSGYQPISAISLGSRMAETILNANEELVHGYTYSGHPVASAVALKNLETIEKLNLVARAKNDIGPYLQRRLRETFDNHPIVGEVRGFGLLAAIELVPDNSERAFFPDIGRVGTHCRNYCFNNGLISRAIRDTMVLAPPLIVSEAEIEEILVKLKDAIDRTARDFRKM